MGADSITLSYPVALQTNSDGTLTDPASMSKERMKIALNKLLCPYGQTPYGRDIKTFPGVVPTGKSTSEKRVSFDLSFDNQGRNHLKNWKSTGMYAPPNQDVKIRIHNAASVAFNVRIGPHTDMLDANSDSVKYQKKYLRSPIASTVITIEGSNSTGEVIVRSDLGGLIILESNRSQNAVADVTIQNAIAAPYYDGSQTQAAWESVCSNPVPWGEVEGRHFVLTERSEKLRTLTKNQLDALVSYYDNLVADCEEFSGFSDQLQKGKWRFPPRTQDF